MSTAIMKGENDLQRFIEAQDDSYGSYAEALEEIGAGRKESHWMWYVFPQLRGLGRTETSFYYGIQDLDEARCYLADPVLGARLREISKELLRHKGKSAETIMGYPDNLKLRSCMTLFNLVEPKGIFQDVLDAFFNGNEDDRTVSLISRCASR